MKNKENSKKKLAALGADNLAEALLDLANQSDKAEEVVFNYSLRKKRN